MKSGVYMVKTNAGRGACGRIVLGLASAAFVLLLSTGLLGQGETTSAILGQVTDSTNAAVPGATVTVVNQETGLKRTAKTDDAGRFNFPQLKPGTTPCASKRRASSRSRRTMWFPVWVKNRRSTSLCKWRSRSRRLKSAGKRRSSIPANANTSTTLNAPGAGKPAESGRRHDLSLAVRAGRADQHRGQRQRFRRRHATAMATCNSTACPLFRMATSWTDWRPTIR